MRQIITLGSGKEHYLETEEDKTLCGLDLEEREFDIVASTQNLCMRCYNKALEVYEGTSVVSEISDEPLGSTEDFTTPAKGTKV